MQNTIYSDELVVTITRIAGTSYSNLEAWEPYAGHSTIRTIGSDRFGRIGCRELPDELEALEHCSDERAQRVDNWHESQYEEAYDLICSLTGLPRDTDYVRYRRSMGSILVTRTLTSAARSQA